MKQFILLLVAVFTTINVCAQEAFNELKFDELHNRSQISFTAKNNVNVRYYRVEGSYDNKQFNIIASIPATSNSLRSVTFSHDLAGVSYKYYRVAKVNLDGTMPYSKVITKENKTQSNKHIQYIVPTISNVNVIANR